jgi:flavin-dependent dehydrogenase
VLLGDAAVAIDPVTGAGMSHALLSAEMLARAIARRQGPDDHATLHASDDVLEEFDRRRNAIYREAVLFSGMVLALVKRPRVARGAFKLMRHVPSLFGHLIGVAGGLRPLVPF